MTDAKKPWKDVKLSDFIESRYLFYSALSRSILPYCIFNPELVTLPIKITKDDQGLSKIKVMSPMEIMYDGARYANKWFSNCENIWANWRTDKSAGMSANDRINFQRGLDSQNIDARYLVIYNSSAKNANAGVLDRTTLDLPFILDHKAYGYVTNNELEAYYLVAFLNSSHANLMIKDFQTRGLFGPRDIHKKILDVIAVLNGQLFN